ncbi:MAG: DUF1289 domain-containing protein [Gammaproteobacteria bacterium]|uniref:Fe-S protein n=1 Tax=Marinobacter litoralis TaxID=187981 RepID=A0A3M2REP7_9GAMM|nr:DUF1289 domain-containing protein [Marinobacter litoralis]MBR9870703.1 DUF1289 domain-containing protein [Gammaproteobacteria bacterium]RMJ03783.1 hypothetical protein DOQ08_01101 [Marinobacter litoralis]
MKVRDRVRSPCVAVCALNDDDICIGCQRSGDEILRWSSMTDDERRQVLKNVAEREEKFQI